MRDVRALSRAGRINQIIVVFEQSIKRGAGDELTAYDIANKIGMRPQSPAFRDHLKAALDEKVITCREVKTNRLNINGGVKFVYKLAQDKTPKKREIKINKNGRPAGQLELF